MKPTTLPTDEEASLFIFIRCSREMSVSVNRIATAIKRLDQSYTDINNAVAKLPLVYDQNSLIDKSLMEETLRGDLKILDTSMLEMKKHIAETVEILITSSTCSLEENKDLLNKFSSFSKAISMAKIEMINSIETLTKLKHSITLA